MDEREKDRAIEERQKRESKQGETEEIKQGERESEQWQKDRPKEIKERERTK